MSGKCMGAAGNMILDLLAQIQGETINSVTSSGPDEVTVSLTNGEDIKISATSGKHNLPILSAERI